MISGQNGTQNLGGAYIQGIADAGVALDDIGALYTNPAGAVFIEDWAIDVSADRRYNLKDLTTLSFAAAKQVGFGTVGLVIGQYGFDEFAEQKIGLSYGRLLTQSIALAGQLDVIGYKISGFGNTYKVTAEFGIITRLGKQITIGAHIYNPTSIKITSDEELDSRLKLGLNYHPTSKIDFYSELEKIIDRDIQIKLGMVYTMLDNFDITAGSNLTLESLHVGFRYRPIRGMMMAISFTYNNTSLGNTPAFSGQYYPSPVQIEE